MRTQSNKLAAVSIRHDDIAGVNWLHSGHSLVGLRLAKSAQRSKLVKVVPASQATYAGPGSCYVAWRAATTSAAVNSTERAWLAKVRLNRPDP
jgi:hypothetical protein